MKKLLAIAIFALLALVACGGNGAQDISEQTQATQDDSEQAQASDIGDQTEATPEPAASEPEVGGDGVLRHIALGDTFIHIPGGSRQLEVTIHDSLTVLDLDPDIAQFFRFRNADGEMENPTQLARIPVTIINQGELESRLDILGILGPESLIWDSFRNSDVGMRQPSNGLQIRDRIDPYHEPFGGFIGGQLAPGETFEGTLWFPLSGSGSYRVAFYGGNASKTYLQDGTTVSGNTARVLYFVID